MLQYELSDFKLNLYTLLYFIILYCTLSCFIILHHTLLYFIVLYHTLLYFIILYYTLSYFIILYFRIFHFTLFHYYSKMMNHNILFLPLQMGQMKIVPLQLSFLGKLTACSKLLPSFILLADVMLLQKADKIYQCSRKLIKCISAVY